MVSMVFMQLSGFCSIRDIANGLLCATGNLSYLGIYKSSSKSSISYLNRSKSYEVFQDLYFELLRKMEPRLEKAMQYAPKLKWQIYIDDYSIIPLSFSLFDWAKFCTTKGAIKLHAVLVYDIGLPNYVVISDGKKPDVKVVKNIAFPSGSVVVTGRANVAYTWLHNLASTEVFSVTRL